MLTVQGRSFATGILVTLTLVSGAFATELFLNFNNGPIQIPLTGGFINSAFLTPSDLPPGVKIDSVLDQMASGNVGLKVLGKYQGQSFTLTGGIQPGTVANPVDFIP